MSDHDLQFIDSHLARLTAAIERGEATVQITPDFLVLLLEDCRKTMALTGENERLKSQVYDLVTVAMGAEYALEYPDDNLVMSALSEYEAKWGDLPTGPKPDAVRAIMLAACKRFREECK